MRGDCALLYYLMFKFGECWVTLYIIWIIFFSLLTFCRSNLCRCRHNPNKSNSTVQRKCCSKYNQSGLIMVEELLDYEMFWNTHTYFKKTLYPMRYHCFPFEIKPTPMPTNIQNQKTTHMNHWNKSNVKWHKYMFERKWKRFFLTS